MRRPGEEVAEDLVRFEDVHMVFSTGLRRPVWALRGLTLGIPRGAVLGLLGPNGAGKTTAIACLLGLLEPQVGVVSMQTRSVAALLEETRLPPFLSVRAALEMTCAIRNVKGAASELDRVVALTRSRELLERTVATLSKGQSRKVGLAAALVGEPELLVLDEPSSGLDAEARAEFDQLVRELGNGQRTMIIASHMLGDVESTCSHVAVMREGRLVLAGRTNELLADARSAQGSDIHVDAASAAALATLGVDCEPSRYPGLVVLRSRLPDGELLGALASAGIIPKRLEPRVNMLSIYLNTLAGESKQ